MLISATTVPPAAADPDRRLVAAIIVRAVRDLDKRGTRHARDAAAYVSSANFDVDCRLLGFDPDHCRRALGVS